MNVEGDEQTTVSEADCFLKALEMVGNCYVATLEGMQYDTILSLKWMQPTASKQSAFNNERGAVHRTANSKNFSNSSTIFSTTSCQILEPESGRQHFPALPQKQNSGK